MPSSPKQTIAFFGSTGGVTSTSLACALRAGYTCTALVRTPSKLLDILKTQHGIPESTIDQFLHIHEGDVLSPETVSRALVSPLDSRYLVDTIISGIGAYPVFRASLLHPMSISDPTICEMGMKSVLSAIDLLAKPCASTAANSVASITSTPSGSKPHIIAISTTGISSRGNDVPWYHWALYYILLHVPHVDKRKMEAELLHDKGEHIRDYTIVRPTLLTDAVLQGTDRVRAGWEWGTDERAAQEAGRVEKEPGAAKGATIGRKDVGTWVFEKIVVEGGWEGKCVSLTY